jgi:predicted 3-demethylubiquinone-9 3-methyltransferase (glyoxalase superfamily)
MKNPVFPCLWFSSNAREAAAFYCSVFTNAQITYENPAVVFFEVNGQKFMCLNGGPEFSFNESVSFVIECANQQEIDYYWNALTADGTESQCGWLKDKYGVSWQVVPAMMGDLMQDPARAQRVMEAMMPMKKLDIDALVHA